MRKIPIRKAAFAEKAALKSDLIHFGWLGERYKTVSILPLSREQQLDVAVASVSPLITELGSVSFIRLLPLACQISDWLVLSKICPIGYLAFKKQMLIATHFIAIWRASVYRTRSKILLMIVFLAVSWLKLD